MEKVNVFTVPEGYFDTIHTTILATVNIDEGGILPSLSKQPAFDVPAGYFESLAGNILAKIKSEQNQADELKGLSPLLYSIQNENVFSVPNGYFDGLADSIMSKLKPRPAKIVPMRSSYNIFKYAAAASVIGIMALGMYKFNGAAKSDGVVTASLLSPSIQQGTSMNNAQFDATLNDLSTAEITNYLVKHNDEADVAAITSGLNEQSVPSQDDYIMDEKTLDNYLQEINSTSSQN
jgi:hypothetical protein